MGRLELSHFELLSRLDQQSCVVVRSQLQLDSPAGGEFGGRTFDITFPVLAGERRAATLTPVGRAAVAVLTALQSSWASRP
jgi:hypothetical protein